MQASELALAKYRQKSGLVSNQNPTVLAQELSETKAQLAVAQAHTAEAAVRLSQAQGVVSSPSQSASKSGTDSSGTAPESQILQRLREQQVGLQADLAALKGSLGPNHPKTLQLQAQLREVNGAIGHEGAGFVGRQKAELAAAQATEAALNRKVVEFTRQFAEVNGGDTQLQSLIGEADADRKAYEQYLARSNELQGSMGNARPDAILFSRAAVPLKPSFPDIPNDGDGRYHHRRGRRHCSGRDARCVAGRSAKQGAGRGRPWHQVPGLWCQGSALSSQPASGCRAAESDRALHASGTAEDGVWRGHPQRAIEITRVLTVAAVSTHPADGRAEHAARLVLGLTSTDNPVRRINSQVVLVTAALPEEGKTSVAVGLSASLAAEGFRVVLVDCDLHRPAVHRMFNTVREPGLTDYFAGSVALDEIIHSDPVRGWIMFPSVQPCRNRLGA